MTDRKLQKQKHKEKISLLPKDLREEIKFIKSLHKNIPGAKKKKKHSKQPKSKKNSKKKKNG